MATLAATAALFGPHVVSGGFVSDDWGWASRWAGREVRGGALDAFLGGSRPLLGLYFLATHAMLGLHVHLHLALQAFLAAAVCVAFYALLRLLHVPRAASFT
ncbi:MAG: hypothetical protein R3C15_23955, partial [Thermoleophilia bacterium]